MCVEDEISMTEPSLLPSSVDGRSAALGHVGAADVLLREEDRSARRWVGEVLDGIPIDEDGWERTQRYPIESVKLLGQAGVLGLTLPTALGGGGRDRLTSVAVHEEIARRSLTLAEVAQIALNGPPYALSKVGAPALGERILPAVMRGEHLMAIAITEEDAGSDLGALATLFEIDGDEVVVSGHKCFVTAGSLAGSFLVLGRFSGTGLNGLGYVLVDGTCPGVEVERTWTKMGGNAIPEAAVRFDRCRLSIDNVVVGPSPRADGFKHAMRSYNAMRLGIAAIGLGAGQASLDRTVAHLRGRQQFGAPLASLQGLRWRIARLSTRLEQARLLTYAAAQLVDDHGFPPARETAAAKLAATEVAIDIANEEIQLAGWRGMVQGPGNPAELHFRQLRGWAIAGGTSESLLNAIAASVLGRIEPTGDMGAWRPSE